MRLTHIKSTYGQVLDDSGSVSKRDLTYFQLERNDPVVQEENPARESRSSADPSGICDRYQGVTHQLQRGSIGHDGTWLKTSSRIPEGEREKTEEIEGGFRG